MKIPLAEAIRSVERMRRLAQAQEHLEQAALLLRGCEAKRAAGIVRSALRSVQAQATMRCQPVAARPA